MNETSLTEAVTDGGNPDPENNGLVKKAARHPVMTGAAIIAGAGLAYVAIKTIQSAADSVAREVHVETSIAIDKSPAELFSFWRDFKNLPLFMRNLESVTEIDARTSHWVAKGAGDSKIEWDAEIINEKQNEMIAWRSLEDSDVVHAGSVRFEQGPAGHGTYVRVTMNYNPPAGKVGAAVAHLLGSDPGHLIKQDLRCLKQMLEAGEIATVEGQTSGRATSAESTPESAASSETEALSETAGIVGLPGEETAQ